MDNEELVTLLNNAKWYIENDKGGNPGLALVLLAKMDDAIQSLQSAQYKCAVCKTQMPDGEIAPALLCDKCSSAYESLQSAEPVAYLTWYSRLIAVDDAIEGFEVAKAGDKSDDGKPAFPVYTHPSPVQAPAGTIEEDGEGLYARLDSKTGARIGDGVYLAPVQAQSKCSACGGDGYYKGVRLGDEPCPDCKGQGSQPVQAQIPDKARMYAVQSVTGVHIGLWKDHKTAADAQAEHPESTILELALLSASEPPNTIVQGEWVKSSERLPERRDADMLRQVWVIDESFGAVLRPYDDVTRKMDHIYPYWMPTGLVTPPKPPTEG